MMSSSSSPLTLDNLGQDILSRTFQFLPIHDVLTLRSTCSSFRQAGDIDNLWFKRSIELVYPLCVGSTKTYRSSASTPPSSTDASSSYPLSTTSSMTATLNPTNTITAYDIVLAHKLAFRLSSWYATFILLAKYGPFEGLYRGIKTGSPRGFVGAVQTKATSLQVPKRSSSYVDSSIDNGVVSRSSSLLSSSSFSSLSPSVPSSSSSTTTIGASYTVGPTVITPRVLSRTVLSNASPSPNVSRTPSNDTILPSSSSSLSTTVPLNLSHNPNNEDGITLEMYEPAVGTLFPVPMGMNPPPPPNNPGQPSPTSAPPVATKVRLHCFLHPRTGIPLRLVGVYLCPRENKYIPVLYNVKVNRGMVKEYMKDNCSFSMLDTASPQTFLFTRIPHEWLETEYRDSNVTNDDTDMLRTSLLSSASASTATLPSNDLGLLFRRWLLSLLHSYFNSFPTDGPSSPSSLRSLLLSPKNTSIHNRHTLMVNGWIPVSFALERLPPLDVPPRAIDLMYNNPQYLYLRHIVPLIGLWRSIYSLHGAEYILITIEEMGERDPNIPSNDIHAHSSPYRILQNLRNNRLPRIGGHHDNGEDDSDNDNGDNSEDDADEENGNNDDDDDDEYEFENYTDENEFIVNGTMPTDKLVTENSTAFSAGTVSSSGTMNSSSSSSSLPPTTATTEPPILPLRTSNFAVTSDSINATLRASHDSYDLTMYYTEKSTSSSSSSSSPTVPTTAANPTFSVSAFSNLVASSITSSILQANHPSNNDPDASKSLTEDKPSVDTLITHASSSLSSLPSSVFTVPDAASLPYDPPLYPAAIDIVPSPAEILPNVRSLPTENRSNVNDDTNGTTEKKLMEETLRGLWRQIFNQSANDPTNTNPRSTARPTDDDLYDTDENDLAIDMDAETVFFTKVMRSLRTREWQYSRNLPYAKYNTFQISNTVETSTFWGNRSRKRLHPSQYGLCLMARKITGDQNVPSGQYTFQIHLEPESSVNPHDIVPPDAFVVSFEDRPSIRDIYSIPVLSAHRGRGQVNMSPEIWDPKTSKGFVFVRQPKPKANSGSSSGNSTTPKSPRTTTTTSSTTTIGSPNTNANTSSTDTTNTDKPLPELTFLWRHAGLETFLAHDFTRVYFNGVPAEYFGPPVVSLNGIPSSP